MFAIVTSMMMRRRSEVVERLYTSEIFKFQASYQSSHRVCNLKVKFLLRYDSCAQHLVAGLRLMLVLSDGRSAAQG